jgi:hypothetical protein
MPRDTAKLAPWFDVSPNKSSIYLLVLAYCSGLRLVASSSGTSRKREVVKTLALGNVASAMMHVQRQR